MSSRLPRARPGPPAAAAAAFPASSRPPSRGGDLNVSAECRSAEEERRGAGRTPIPRPADVPGGARSWRGPGRAPPLGSQSGVSGQNRLRPRVQTRLNSLGGQVTWLLGPEGPPLARLASRAPRTGRSRCRSHSFGMLLVAPHPRLPGFKPLPALLRPGSRVTPGCEGNRLWVHVGAGGGGGEVTGVSRSQAAGTECLGPQGTQNKPETPSFLTTPLWKPAERVWGAAMHDGPGPQVTSPWGSPGFFFTWLI